LPEKEEVEKLVIDEMQNALTLRVPVEVSAGFGMNWLEAH
jgi:DNA polymerase-1